MAERKKLHPGFKKNAKVMAVVAGVAVAGVGVAYMAMQGRSSQAAIVEVPAIDTHGAKKTEETPNYSKALNRANEKGFQQAEHVGGTFIPTLSENSGKTTTLEDDPAKRAEANPPPQERDLARPNQPYTATEAQQVQPTSTGLGDQLQGLRAVWTRDESSQQILNIAAQTGDARNANATTTSLAGGGTSTASDGASTKRQATPYIRGLDQIPAVYQNSIDTDAPSDVLASVETGKYAGSLLYGTARLSNEVVVTEFTKMKVPTGEMITITAVALDEAEMRTAQPADIDHRYAQRIGVPALLGALGAAGSVYQNAGSVVQQTPLGGVSTTTNPHPSGKQLGGAAVSAGLQATQQVIQQENASIPPRRGRIKRGTPIMVLFKADAYLKE
ncbi:DotG/IcmE/VirB10 family protein [Cupriavidus nantongensis]|uniref:Conjugal transfer protein TraO n=1 Tax=Cupriavidus nantongensis TaxID=1796606 RepID=A0A142JKI5_9BURK|nr:DotG/IcmE/VirB10 family protein [Cupriavidus nantongensis]AMR78597.1 hypothetical protein A2G96_13065 [Cupriavidus nantongensis]